MTQTATTIAQVGVDRLPALYSSLTAALSEAGLSSGQMGEIFSKYISAECVLCGTRVSGEEMGRITSGIEIRLAPEQPHQRRCSEFMMRPSRLRRSPGNPATLIRSDLLSQSRC